MDVTPSEELFPELLSRTKKENLRPKEVMKFVKKYIKMDTPVKMSKASHFRTRQQFEQSGEIRFLY